MREPIQRDRILKALRQAGRRGVTQRNFDAPNVTDGFSPIPQIARRIHDLRKEWEITSVGTAGQEVYVLGGRVTAPPLTQPITTPDGCWLIVHSCPRCLGCVARPEQACAGPTTRTLWSVNAPAGVVGCRIVEARADAARREVVEVQRAA